MFNRKAKNIKVVESPVPPNGEELSSREPARLAAYASDAYRWRRARDYDQAEGPALYPVDQILLFGTLVEEVISLRERVESLESRDG